MTTLSKILLAVAIVGLTGGIIVACYGENVSPLVLTLVLPLGAVAFGLFLIVFALQKEVSIYDQEQAMKGPAPKCNTAVAPKKSESSSRPTAGQLKEKLI
ncbi:MAG TPA: hypothetical protein VNV43_05260 [Candidatus Acidoferrales bacterium]|jgi:hypothetical protein|nr:hypothetical protein [Candidatus Acidoferrales bacterium]